MRLNWVDLAIFAVCMFIKVPPRQRAMALPARRFTNCGATLH